MTKIKRGLKENTLKFLLGDTQIRETLSERPTVEVLAKDVVGTTTNKLCMLPVAQVQRAKWQPRTIFEPEALQELTDSIKSQGVVQPILVRQMSDAPEPRYEIIAGERRWRAAQLAGLPSIPAIIKEIDDTSALALALIENIQRENLNPLDEARGLQKLQTEFNLTQAEIGQKIGRKRSTIANMLRLLELSPEVQVYIADGQISVGHAKALLGLPDVAQLAIAEQIVQKDLSVRAVEELVNNFAKTSPEPQKSKESKESELAVATDANIQKLALQIAEALGAPVKIQHQKSGAGKLIVKYYNLAELDNILGKLPIERESYV